MEGAGLRTPIVPEDDLTATLVMDRPPEEAVSNPDQSLEDKLRIQVVDMSQGVQAEARESAENYISEQTTQGGFKGFVKKIWHGNLARDYILQKKQGQAKEEIVNSGNLYTLAGLSKDEFDKASQAVVERVSEGFIHSGETQADLVSLQHGADFQSGIKKLVLDFSQGVLDGRQLEEERKRLVSAFGMGLNAEERKKGLLLADNILQVAKHAKEAFKSGVGLDRIDEALRGGTFTDAKTGVRTEYKATGADRIVDYMASRKAGSFVNETTLGLAAGVAIAVTKASSQKVLFMAGATVTMGAAAGLIAGAREHHRVGQERTVHARQKAQGETFDDDAKRRKEMDKAVYETITAQELVGELDLARAVLSPEDGVLDVDSIRATVASIAGTSKRISISDLEGVDLISYSSKEKVEEERFRLDRALASAKVALKRAVDGLSSDERTHLGVDPDNPNTEELLAAVDERVEQDLRGDMQLKDQVFSRLRMKRTAKMATIGFISGEVIGFAAQEAGALISDELKGVTEGGSDNQRRQTLFEGLFGDKDGTSNAEQAQHLLQKNSSVDLPDGFKIDNQGALIDAHGNRLLDSVGVQKDGTLDADTIAALNERGYKVSTVSETIESTKKVPVYTEKHIARTPEGYVQSHPKDFTTISRELWYDNDTAGNFDYNELRMNWGGEDGSGMTRDGDYVFNVAGMNPDGSWHGTESANAQELFKKGDMAIALSVSKGTQTEVIFIPIDRNGNAIIGKNTFAGQNLFEQSDGRARFVGAYAEAVQLGETTNGETSVRMLATVVGDNNVGQIDDVVTQKTFKEVPDVFTRQNITISKELPTQPFAPIPVYGRKGLERPSSERQKSVRVYDPNLGASYYGGQSLEALQSWIQRDRDLLHSRRQITLEDGSIAWVEVDGTPVERSVDRERSTLNKYLETQRAENPRHMEFVEKVADAMGEMREGVRVAVNVPSWMEAATLRHFLNEYVPQLDENGQPLSQEMFEINILINRKTGTEPDNSVEVIEEFLRDYQDSKGFRPSVRYADVEIDPPLNNVGYARKLLTDAVVLRSVRRPSQAGPLYFESEDADMVNIDKRTVQRVIKKMDENPHLDAVRGVQDRAPEYMKDNDYLFLRRRAWDFFEILARKREYRDPSVPGWNFTWNRVVTGGWNTAYTAESYAMIKGYDIVQAGEDMSIGEKITMARGDGNVPNLEVVGTVSSRSDSSPRRFINEIINSKPAYDDFANEEDNATIREKTINELMDEISHYSRINVDNIDSFRSYIVGVHHWTRAVTPDEAAAAEMTKRLLFFLGFKKTDYAFDESGELSISNWQNVKNSLDRYRSRYSTSELVT